MGHIQSTKLESSGENASVKKYYLQFALADALTDVCGPESCFSRAQLTFDGRVLV